MEIQLWGSTFRRLPGKHSPHCVCVCVCVNYMGALDLGNTLNESFNLNIFCHKCMHIIICVWNMGLIFMIYLFEKKKKKTSGNSSGSFCTTFTNVLWLQKYLALKWFHENCSETFIWRPTGYNIEMLMQIHDHLKIKSHYRTLLIFYQPCDEV